MCIGLAQDNKQIREYTPKYLLDSFAVLRKTASNARKVFWLFKSINHMIELINDVNKLGFANLVNSSLSYKLDLIEQLFLVIGSLLLYIKKFSIYHQCFIILDLLLLL